MKLLRLPATVEVTDLGTLYSSNISTNVAVFFPVSLNRTPTTLLHGSLPFRALALDPHYEEPLTFWTLSTRDTKSIWFPGAERRELGVECRGGPKNH